MAKNPVTTPFHAEKTFSHSPSLIEPSVGCKTSASGRIDQNPELKTVNMMLTSHVFYKFEFSIIFLLILWYSKQI